MLPGHDLDHLSMSGPSDRGTHHDYRCGAFPLLSQISKAFTPQDRHLLLMVYALKVCPLAAQCASRDACVYQKQSFMLSKDVARFDSSHDDLLLLWLLLTLQEMTLAAPMPKEDVPDSQPSEKNPYGSGSEPHDDGENDDETGDPTYQGNDGPKRPGEVNNTHRSPRKRPSGQSFSQGLGSTLRIWSLKTMQLGEWLNASMKVCSREIIRASLRDHFPCSGEHQSARTCV